MVIMHTMSLRSMNMKKTNIYLFNFVEFDALTNQQEFLMNRKAVTARQPHNHTYKKLVEIDNKKYLKLIYNTYINIAYGTWY